MNDFTIGSRHRNRKGWYVVEAINGDRVSICYDDGTESEAQLSLLARIEKNVSSDTRPARRSPSARASATPAASITFSGLEEADFVTGVAGTHWRSRDGLGGLLAARTSEILDRTLLSYAPFRTLAVYVADPEVYARAQSENLAKLCLSLDGDCARYGLLIERGMSPPEPERDWWRFHENARRRPGLLARLVQAAQPGKLCGELVLYPEEGAVHLADWWAEEDHIVVAERDRGNEIMSWTDFVEYCHQVESETYLWLWFGKRQSKEQVIALKERLADEVVASFGAARPILDVLY